MDINLDKGQFEKLHFPGSFVHLYTFVELFLALFVNDGPRHEN